MRGANSIAPDIGAETSILYTAAPKSLIGCVFERIAETMQSVSYRGRRRGARISAGEGVAEPLVIGRHRDCRQRLSIDEGIRWPNMS